MLVHKYTIPILTLRNVTIFDENEFQIKLQKLKKIIICINARFPFLMRDEQINGKNTNILF